MEAVAGGLWAEHELPWVVEVPPETVDFDAAADLAFGNEGVQTQNADDVLIITLIYRGDRPRVTNRTAFPGSMVANL